MATPFSFPSSSQGIGGSTRQAPTTKPAPVDLPALRNASQILLEQLAKDAQIIPDLGETLTACEFGKHSAGYTSLTLSSWKPVFGVLQRVCGRYTSALSKAEVYWDSRWPFPILRK